MSEKEEFARIADKVQEETYSAYIDTANKYIAAHAGDDSFLEEAYSTGVAHSLLVAGVTILGQNLRLDKDWCLKEYDKFVKGFAKEYIRRNPEIEGENDDNG